MARPEITATSALLRPHREAGKRLLARLLGPGRRRSLIGATAGAFGLRIVNMVLTLCTSVLLARLLGAGPYGMYAFAIACVTLIEVPAQLGLPTLAVRWTAAYSATGDWSRLRGLLRRCNQIAAASQVVLLVALGAALVVLAADADPEAGKTAAWALALVPLVVLGALRAAVLRGLHHVVLSEVPSMLVRPALFLLLLGLVAFGFGARLTPSTAMALQVLATGAAFLLGASWLWQRLPTSVTTAVPSYETGRWMRSALPLMLIGAVGVVNSQVDMVMLGLLRPTEEVGIYRIAVQAANLVGFACAGINAVIAPTLAQLHAKEEHRRLQQVMTRSAQIGLFLFALPVALGFIVFGGAILGSIFGPAFAVGHAPLAILCLGQLVNAGAGSVGLLLSMTGYERDTAWGLTAAVMLNVPMNLALIPVFGMSGAAGATAATFVFWNAVLAIRVYRRLGIRPTAFTHA